MKILLGQLAVQERSCILEFNLVAIFLFFKHFSSYCMMILTSSVLSLGIVFPHLVLPAAVGSAVVTMHRGFVGEC